MSILNVSEIEKRLAKFYKRLDGFNEKAITRSEGDIYKYLVSILNGWSYICSSDSDFANLCIDAL
ncbi:hypothetical protein SAMN02745111_01215 [Eubacterium uniforme]|uniref:Uncharacterized protein n=1 Tax=Eubacterium uniforme TaxID=39495 RepID=A0A1T4VMA3_9FIRM|nr:hypothetical protein [Eubacterium uniforme]SKA66083.1 hypothetical protein SAMN02745111_01215 [Eubacterium uniforme]